MKLLAVRISTSSKTFRLMEQSIYSFLTTLVMKFLDRNNSGKKLLEEDIRNSFVSKKKQKLSHKSANGRDSKLQYTHIVLLKSPHDVQQIDVLEKQFRLGNTLRMWYADATSDPYGHIKIDLSPKTNKFLRYSTDVTSFPTKFFYRAVDQEKRR